MAKLDDLERLSKGDSALATISIGRVDGTPHASVVNAGVIDNPLTGVHSVAFAARGSSFKIRRLREHAHCSVLFRVGWEWAACDGPTILIGPNDLPLGYAASDVPQILRDVFVAAGGSHDDWDEYDRVMAEDGRTAVFVDPQRIAGPG